MTQGGAALQPYISGNEQSVNALDSLQRGFPLSVRVVNVQGVPDMSLQPIMLEEPLVTLGPPEQYRITRARFTSGAHQALLALYPNGFAIDPARITIDRQDPSHRELFGLITRL